MADGFIPPKRFRHKVPIAERLEARSIPEPNSGCWLWLAACNRRGYGVFGTKDGPKLAHRVAWETWRGAIPIGLQVCHKCDVPTCINPGHLFLGTHDDNMADKMRKGRHGFASGERCHLAKLTNEQVRAIRADKRILREIAADYGVRLQLISQIRRGEIWKHVRELSDNRRT